MQNESERDGHEQDDEPIDARTEPEAGAEDDVKANYAYGRWIAQREHYSALYKLWSRALLFLLGKQWLEYNKETRRWAPEVNVPRWRQRPVTNFCFAVYRTGISKLTKQRPAFDVVPPRSGDSEDQEAAALGEALLQQLWRQLKMSRVYAKMCGWLLSTGNMYIDVFWNPEKGELRDRTVPVEVPRLDDSGQQMQHPDTGEPLSDWQDAAADEEGQPYHKDGMPDLNRQPDQMFEGDVDVRLVAPFCVRHNPDAESPEDAEEWFVGFLVPKEAAAKRHGLDVEDLKGKGDQELEEVDDLMANAAGSMDVMGLGTFASDHHHAIGPRVLELHYYRRPNAEYPQGRYWCQLNRLMTPAGEQELPEGFWPPLVPVQDVPVPGEPHAMGLLQQVVPLNREYNVLNGGIKEHNLTMAMGGKWIVSPEDAKLPINTDPGQKLASKGYLQNRPPVQAKMEGLPPAIYQERERILNDLMLVSGMNELALGKKPEGVGSGRGFLVLQEAVDSVLTPTLYNIEDASQEVGRRMLVLAQRRYREDRTLKVRGHRGTWEIKSFQGADLGDSIDVQVQMGSSFPWSKTARQDLVLETVQALPGLVNKPDGTVDQVRLAKLLNVGGIQAFEAETDEDHEECELEHAMFEAYKPDGGEASLPQIGFWQDHARHLQEHFSKLKRDKHRIAKWSKEAHEAFLQHVLLTQQVVQGLVAMTAGGPAPGPNAGPPAPDGAPAGGPPPNAPPGVGGPAAPSAAPKPPGGRSDMTLQPRDFAAAGQ